MLAIHSKSWAALAVAAAFAAPAAAELSAADIGKLGTTLTPLGGEKAGNAAKSIPEWTGGITKPWMKRQMMSACTSGAIAIIKVGTASATIDAVITRLRPITSATAPLNGAVSATASVPAVMVALMTAALTENATASDGSRDCGE